MMRRKKWSSFTIQSSIAIMITEPTPTMNLKTDVFKDNNHYISMPKKHTKNSQMIRADFQEEEAKDF
jgi:hypothetical protein